METAIITAVAGILASAITFYQPERKNAKPHGKRKSLQYTRLMTALGGIVGDNPTTPEKVASPPLQMTFSLSVRPACCWRFEITWTKRLNRRSTRAKIDTISF